VALERPHARAYASSDSGTPEAAEADVCLVLEGTYPFVLGGVSAWVHHLVRGLPHLTFHLWCIGADEDTLLRPPAYTLPPNVVGVTGAPLRRTQRARPRGNERAHAAAVEAWARALPDLLAALHGPRRAAFCEFLARRTREQWPAVSPKDVLAHPAAFQHLVRVYEAEAADQPFQTFYWTWVSSLLPLLELLDGPLPAARLYHSVTTGYAGLLATRGKLEARRPVLLTEHGIYTKERRIEVDRATWIEGADDGREVVPRNAPYFRRWWNRIFGGLSRLVYGAADEVLTIHHGNTALQLADGADERKLRVVPNGVDASRIEASAAALGPRPLDAPFTVGFVGRVAPIKDVETLLDAFRLLCRERADARLRVLGPCDEDPEYVARCRAHSARLGLEGSVTFEGPVDVAAELPKLDVLVLTSISEAQPLVVLEAGAAGIPVVATDVGACRELLLGRAGADRALGPGGCLTPIGSPRATADALLGLAQDPELRRRMGAAGRARVRSFYAAGTMLDAYGEVYARHLAASQRRVA
jgi:glycosyltransferase involved in cell wall biosynthesis